MITRGLLLLKSKALNIVLCHYGLRRWIKASMAKSLKAISFQLSRHQHPRHPFGDIGALTHHACWLEASRSGTCLLRYKEKGRRGQLEALVRYDSRSAIP